MNTEAISPDRLNALLDYLGNVAQRADGFVVEQAPLLAQEIVAWHVWSNAGSVAVLVAAALAFALLSYLCFKAKEIVEPGVFCGIVSFVLFVGSGFAAANVLKGLVAPRLVILDYVQSVTK